MTIGEKIRSVRIKKGLTQKQLAEKLNTSQQNLAQYESGKRNPKLETIDKIADALGVEAWEFYEYHIIDLFAGRSSISEKFDNTAEAIFIDETEEKNITVDENVLIEKYRSLNETGQNEAQRQMEVLTKVPEYRKEN